MYMMKLLGAQVKKDLWKYETVGVQDKREEF